jgi:hypothetical protein
MEKSEGTIKTLQTIESKIVGHRQELNSFKKTLGDIALAMDALYRAANSLSSATNGLDSGLETLNDDVATCMMDVEQMRLTARHERLHCPDNEQVGSARADNPLFLATSVRDLPSWH